MENQTEHVPHFPTAKIKKMIQHNQDIGKLSNSIPHLLEYSLQVFLESILSEINAIATEGDYGKITPALLKIAIKKSGKYDFLLGSVEEIDESEPPKRKRTESQKEGKPAKKRKTEKQSEWKQQKDDDA